MIARVCPEQQTIREAIEEPKKHSDRDVLCWVRQLFSPEHTCDVFVAVRMCGVACAFVCACMCLFESFSTTETQNLVVPYAHPGTPCMTPFGHTGVLFVCV
jgi:hypothetical protein